MSCRKFFWFIISCFLLISNYVLAQRTPDPHTGDPLMRRQGIMDGNLVRTIFINWGEIAHWPDSPSGEWPKGTGHQYVDGVALIVQARTIDNNGNVIYPLETQYREFVDTGPKGELWGWAPLPGYFYPKSSEPAMSDDPSTWPDTWPDEPTWINPNEVRDGIDNDHNGLIDDVVYWDGFFGKGVRNADLETYFVFDDDPDEEWDFYPDPSDTSRRGLGIEVAARYFQWSQVLAEDVIFAVYFITNEGKTKYDSTYYAFYIDWGIGGTDDSSDDTGDYDLSLDIAWAWDYDGYGSPGRWFPVGVAGFAFLESPGIKDDGKDNDEDGLIDEKRDSGPGVWLDKYPYGVDDPQKFEEFYGRPPEPHWSGDEDIDWKAYEDVNENGQWDPGEPLNDDVGADGIGPFDPNYTGPDEGEADGMPTEGEPNFDKTDKDESDQIGLTGFRIFPVHTYELWNEDQDWDVFRSAPPPHSSQITANLGMFFSSGPFPLRPLQTENYSMALIFADDRDDLIRTKKTVQQIYNADYRFAKPPDKPKLIAIPGDKKVTLVWDSRAEKSYDPFLQEYDFEGYRIYRSTEPQFLERRLITDAYGRPTFRKPIAQFDLKDGIKGLHPIDVQGVKFDLGEDTGLRHVYVDHNVQNGQTYYYAVVSYDRGLVDTSATGEIVGIPPSESPSVIKVDIAGNVQTDVNTAVVTPSAPAAGYRPPKLAENVKYNGVGTGSFKVNFVIPDSVRDTHTYKVEFSDTSLYHDKGTPFYSIIDVTNGQNKKLVENLPVFEDTESPVVDGFTVNIFNDPEVDLDYSKTGWLVGSSNFIWDISLDNRFSKSNIKYPADYEITFSNQIIDTSTNFLGLPPIPTKFSVYNLTEDKPADFMFLDFYRDSTLTPITEDQSLTRREQILIIEKNPDDPQQFVTTWRLTFEVDTNATDSIPPQPGDVFRISTIKPFRTGDSFTFKVAGAKFDLQKSKSDMDKIAVVPNPYVVAASWEPQSPFRFGRGERRIYFINLPPKCTIRIYTIRGYLVDTIEHNSTIANGQEPWNLLSKDGQDIAYGVYIYHVDAPGVGEKIGKFAIIK